MLNDYLAGIMIISVLQQGYCI